MDHGTCGAVGDLLSRIDGLIRADDLAAVIVHLNDTYRIEERTRRVGSQEQPILPGMARLAALFRRIRTTVADALGEDRTLILHSGDFLSPSFMSRRLGSQGKQMVGLLDACGVDYVTLGNHEFDYERDKPDSPVLAAGLRNARFGVVASNLSPPADFRPVDSLVAWPKRDPFIGLLGIAGRATAAKAEKHGWTARPWREALTDRLDEVRKKQPGISCIVALSHMERAEDHQLVTALNEGWREDGSGFVLGGHDHDVFWPEPQGHFILSKNLLNARSITVILLTKTLVAAPRGGWGAPARRRMTRAEGPEFARRLEVEPGALQADLPVLRHGTQEERDALARRRRAREFPPR